MDNEPKEDLKEEIKEALADLFENVEKDEAQIISIPSGGTLKMRPLTFDDERRLASLTGASVEFLTEYINSCTDRDVSELWIVDKLFLISKLRSISFGSEYSAECTCPECDAKNSLTIDLNDLAVGMGDNFSGEITINLPKMDKSAILSLPKIKDEGYFSSADILHSNLWRFIKQIGDYTNGPLIAEAVKQMPITDIHAVLKALQPEDIGLQTQIMLACNKCNKQSVMELPINEGFFIVK